MTASQFVHIRAFPAEIQRTGPRQLTGRLVPYDTPADVLDILADGRRDIYREGFRRGVFGTQTATQEKGVLARIGLVHAHENGIGYLGPFTGLREADDGLYGDAQILRSKVTDVEDLLGDGVRELSIEFRLARKDHTEVDAAGVRWRTRAHLDRVALEAKGAYSAAEVLSFRSQIDTEHREEAEATAAADAARQAEADEAAARRAVEQEADERRRRWEMLTARVDAELAEQDELIRRYGLTRPAGFRRLT